MTDKKTGVFENKFRKILNYATWVLVAILLFSAFKNIGKVINIRRQVEEERTKVEKLEKENAILMTRIAESQESEYIEEQIRNRLGFVKGGETKVILPDEDVVRSFAPSLDMDTDFLPDPNWVKWLHLFISK